VVGIITVDNVEGAGGGGKAVEDGADAAGGLSSLRSETLSN
jgi:hypothetical protein